jgi:hypothetical protein
MKTPSVERARHRRRQTACDEESRMMGEQRRPQRSLTLAVIIIPCFMLLAILKSSMVEGYGIAASSLKSRQRNNEAIIHASSALSNTNAIRIQQGSVSVRSSICLSAGSGEGQGLGSITAENFDKSTQRKETTQESSIQQNKLLFPGGGIFFYWQAGAMTYLRENGYNLDQVSMSGASAGALSATLTATGVDFAEATELALDLSQKAGVWDRPLGLQGVWGPLIYEWLDTLLPEDALDQVSNERVSSRSTIQS